MEERKYWKEARVPAALKDYGAKVINWDTRILYDAIERAT
jgi:hypothetical protein